MVSDAELLASLEEKTQLLRDRTRGVAEGYANGLYAWGEGGTSKSYTVEQTLKDAGKPYKLSNSRVTGRGLFDLLKLHPDLVHVLEDAETLFADRNSFGVLRGALWGQTGQGGKQERIVCWHTAKRADEFVFTGGLIITANVALDDIPELRAVKSRIASVHFLVSDEEIAAKMRELARRGHSRAGSSLSPDQCREVADEIVSRSARLRRNLDLRLLFNGFNDRLQFEDGHAETHWHDLLDSRLKERVIDRPHVGIRAQKKEGETEVARQIAHLPGPERLAAWRERTGKSRAALYRRLADLGVSDVSLSQPATLGETPVEMGLSGAEL